MIVKRGDTDYVSSIINHSARRYKVLRHFRNVQCVYCYSNNVGYSEIVRINSFGCGNPYIIANYDRDANTIIFMGRRDVVALFLKNISKLYVFTRNDTMIRDLVLYLESEGLLSRDRQNCLGDITLGADPEYEVFDCGTWKSAARILEDVCDDDLYTSPIGCDGCSDTLELRPAPSSTPRGAVHSLSALIAEFDRNYAFALSVKGDTQALGGHIHIGFANWRPEMRPSPSFLAALDRLLYVSLLDRFNGTARGSYGKRSAWESKQWGFEYRSLPGAAFANPEVALFCYTIVYGIAKLYSEKPQFTIPDDIEEAWAFLGASEEMIKKFKDFLSCGWDFYDVAHSWETGQMKKALPVGVFTFSDSWSLESKEWLFENITANLPLHFYGLMESRGEVVQIGSLIYNIDTGACCADESRAGIGIPFSARHGNFILLRKCFKMLMDHVSYISFTEDANVCDNG